MKIVLGIFSDNSDVTAGCELALVELTADYARRIAARMAGLLNLYASDGSLDEAHYWDSHARYFDDPELEEALEAAAEGYLVLDEGAELAEELFQRVEYTHLVIAVDDRRAEVYWRAAPKNVSAYVETRPLPQALIEEVAASAAPLST